MPSPVVFWFRRDLRLADHPALEAAAAAGPVVAAFVFDPLLWDRSGPNRQAFLLQSLQDLNRSMGESLTVVQGAPGEAIPELARTVGADRVFATEDFAPYGRRRDAEVGARLAEAGIRLELVDSPYAVPPGSVLTGGGTSYKVFTPFFRAWKNHGWAAPTGQVAVEWSAGPASCPIPTVDGGSASLPEAGEDAAWRRVDEFLDFKAESEAEGEGIASEGIASEGIAGYQAGRDRPGIDGTSRLSTYLKWGVVHPRQLLDRLGATQAEEVFRSEICWREFYAEVLFQRPDSARSAYVTKMRDMEINEGPEADQRFAAWSTGHTGYPIVDAGMRQLIATGWMHNRVRMIVASFLVKDLHIDWRRGARLFMHHLCDGDLASNTHGWQWVAGTGTDASPYFRIFNPITQSKKFDPDGTYLRLWLPEIAHLPDRSIHEPWTEKTGAPAGYPPPIVDHAMERKESLERYEHLKRTWA